MRRIVCVLLVGAVLIFCATLAFGDDIVPPPWPRNHVRTTFERWEFTTQQQTTPTEVQNQYGTPTASFTADHWDEYLDNRHGVWTMSGTSPTLDFTVPNAPGGGARKDIQLQLTWKPLSTTSVNVVCNGVTAGLYNQQTVDPDPWLHTTWRLSISPNPDSEIITIVGNGGFCVDEVVIDTICVPEPSSLLALAGSVLGLAGLAWKRRR